MFRYAILCFAVLASVCGQLSDEEKEEMKKIFLPAVLECLDEMGISKEDFEKMKENKDPANVDHCLLACTMKKTKMFDDDGKFVKEVAVELAQKIMKNDETVAKVKEIGEDCSSVNEEKVSDGAKGCERAKLLALCFKKHHSAFGQV